MESNDKLLVSAQEAAMPQKEESLVIIDEWG